MKALHKRLKLLKKTTELNNNMFAKNLKMAEVTQVELENLEADLKARKEELQTLLINVYDTKKENGNTIKELDRILGN